MAELGLGFRRGGRLGRLGLPDLPLRLALGSGVLPTLLFLLPAAGAALALLRLHRLRLHRSLAGGQQPGGGVHDVVGGQGVGPVEVVVLLPLGTGAPLGQHRVQHAGALRLLPAGLPLLLGGGGRRRGGRGGLGRLSGRLLPLLLLGGGLVGGVPGTAALLGGGAGLGVLGVHRAALGVLGHLKDLHGPGVAPQHRDRTANELFNAL